MAVLKSSRKETLRRASSGRSAGDERVPPTQEAIAKLAYELYLKRGETHGQDWADWFQAETLLTAPRS